MRVRKYFLIFTLSVLIFPGAAFGTVFFEFDHPETVVAGEVFELSVRIVGDDPVTDPDPICTYMTYLEFDEFALELTAFNLESFFEVPSPFMPLIYTAIGGYDPLGPPQPITSPGAFGSMSMADLLFNPPPDPPEPISPVYHPYNKKTATYTFRALVSGPVQFNLPDGDCSDPGCVNFSCVNIVTGCDSDQDTPIEERPPPEIVPTLNQFGTVFLIFAMAVGALRIIKRRRGA